MSDNTGGITPDEAERQIAALVAAAGELSADVIGLSHELAALSVSLSAQGSPGLAAVAQRAAVSVLEVAVSSGRNDVELLTWFAESRHTFAQRLTDDGQFDAAAIEGRLAVPGYLRAASTAGADVLHIAVNLTWLQKLLGHLGQADDALSTQLAAVSVMRAYTPAPALEQRYQDLLSDLLVTLAARLTDAGRPDLAQQQVDAAAYASFQNGLLIWNDVAEASATLATQASQLSALGFTTAAGITQELAFSSLIDADAYQGVDADQLGVLNQAGQQSDAADEALRRILAAIAAKAEAKRQLGAAVAKLDGMRELEPTSTSPGLAAQASAALQRFAGGGAAGSGGLYTAPAPIAAIGDGPLERAERIIQEAQAVLIDSIRFCGVPDPPAIPVHPGPFPQPVIEPTPPEPHWDQGHLTVSIDPSGAQFATQQGDPPDVIELVTAAFLQWQAAGLLVADGFFSFTLATVGQTTADISVSFVDAPVEAAFTGSTAILGIGTPPQTGDTHVHLKAARTWTVDQLQAVVLHCVGHVLGLHHNATTGTLMNPGGGRIRAIDDPATQALAALYH